MDTFAQIAEIHRRLDAMVSFGVVTDTKASEGKALVRVAIYERVTDWLPVAGLGNDFFKLWVPPRAGMQVTVISPGGNPEYGVVIPAIFNTQCKEPAGAGEANVIVEVGQNRIEMDGTSLRVAAPGGITLDTPTLALSGNLSVGGAVRDSRGDLTNFNTTDGASRA